VRRSSPRLARALAAECAALARERARLEAQRDALRAALAGAEAELGALDERLALLERLGPAPRPAPGASPGCDARPGRPLRGAAVRETAVRVLADHPAGAAPIHHRAWYALLVDAGFRVEGKDPLAVFLTQVTRSPVVRRAGAPGEYVLDRDAPEALRRRLAEQHERLRRHAADRAHREALLAVVAQTERAVEEAERSLTLAPLAAR
jgi:hypothetical protein